MEQPEISLKLPKTAQISSLFVLLKSEHYSLTNYIMVKMQLLYPTTTASRDVLQTADTLFHSPLSLVLRKTIP